MGHFHKKHLSILNLFLQRLRWSIDWFISVHRNIYARTSRVAVYSSFRNLNVLSYFSKATVLKVFPTFPHTQARASQKSKRVNSVLLFIPTHQWTHTRHICVYVSEVSQIRPIWRRGADFCRGPSTARVGEALSCVSGFLTCCNDTDRTSRVSPEERSRNTNTFSRACKKKWIAVAQKPGECQKWHNENNESRLPPAKDVEGCLWPSGKVVFIFITWPPPVMNIKNKKEEVTCVLARILQCNHMKSNLALNNYCAATEYLSSDTWGILLSPSQHTVDDLTSAKKTNRLPACKLMKAGQKNDLLHWMPIWECPGESQRKRKWIKCQWGSFYVPLNSKARAEWQTVRCVFVAVAGIMVCLTGRRHSACLLVVAFTCLFPGNQQFVIY